MNPFNCPRCGRFMGATCTYCPSTGTAGHTGAMATPENITPEQAMDDLLESVAAAQPDLDDLLAGIDASREAALKWVEDREIPGIPGT